MKDPSKLTFDRYGKPMFPWATIYELPILCNGVSFLEGTNFRLFLGGNRISTRIFEGFPSKIQADFGMKIGLDMGLKYVNFV